MSIIPIRSKNSLLKIFLRCLTRNKKTNKSNKVNKNKKKKKKSSTKNSKSIMKKEKKNLLLLNLIVCRFSLGKKMSKLWSRLEPKSLKEPDDLSIIFDHRIHKRGKINY